MKFSIFFTTICISSIIATASFFGCNKKDEPPMLYEVTGFESSSGQYTLVRVDNTSHKRVQFVLICNFYKWGNKTPVDGPHSCDLSVGQILVPNPLPKNPRKFLDIWQLGDTFFITSDSDTNRVEQQFTIKSAHQIE